MFGAISGVRHVNWGRLIQEYVEKSILHIGWKPSFLPPYILHLYQHYGCINEAEEDALTIADDKVVYKLGSDVEVTEAGMEESSRYPAVPEPPPSAPVPEPRRATTPQPRHNADPSREQPWRIIDLFNFKLSKTLFQQVRTGLTNTGN